MSGLIKTLFGDKRNILVVLLILAIEMVLVKTGNAPVAAYAMPLITLCGVSYLARH